MRIKDYGILTDFAKNLRKTSTDVEKILWYYLRGNRLGFKFKRQVPIGKYIVDFVCFSKHLIIELDGGHHQNKIFYDKERTKFLNKEGFKVLRFWNNEVLLNIESVLDCIYQALTANDIQKS